MQNDTTKKPTPAIGHVWHHDTYGALTVGHADVLTEFAAMLKNDPRARCVGIETPAGRVMVGDRRMCAGPNIVLAIVDRGVLTRHEATGREEVFTAEGVATWPLAAEPAPGDPYRMPFDWDRASVRDFKMPIPFAMASGPRMPMPEATATAQKACGCWVCKMIAEGRAKPMSQRDADALAERLHVKMNPRPSAPILSIPFAVDPRAAREQRRREIDAVLREDARRFPAFATARRAAVMAVCERAPDLYTSAVASMLGWIREYEDARGAATRPSDAAILHARATFGEDAQTAYERARAMP